MKTYHIKSVIAGVCIFLLSLTVQAQGFEMEGPPSNRTVLGLKFIHPTMADGSLSFASGVWDFSVSVPLGNNSSIVGSLPLVRISGNELQSESGIGNIYAGFRYRLFSSRMSRMALSVGVYIPTVSEDKLGLALTGLYSYYYKLPKFAVNTFTVSGNLSYYIFSRGGLMFGLEVGPDLLLPSEGGTGQEKETYLHYGLSAGYRIRQFTFKVEYVGIGILTEEFDSFSDRFINALIFGIQWRQRQISPGIFYKIYLRDELNDVVKSVVGISLAISLR